MSPANKQERQPRRERREDNKPQKEAQKPERSQAPRTIEKSPESQAKVGTFVYYKYISQHTYVTK